MSNNISPTGKRTERAWDPIDQNEQGNKFVIIDEANLLFNFAQTIEQCALSNIGENAVLSEKEGDSKRLKGEAEQPVLLRTETLPEDLDLWPDVEFSIDPNDPLLDLNVDFLFPDGVDFPGRLQEKFIDK